MSARSEADKIVKTHVIWGMGAGLIPVPLADMAAVTVIQIDMLREVGRVYGQDLSRDSLKTFVSALTGGAAARLAASLIKGIPGIGTAIGGLSMSVMSGASTYAVGQVALRQLDKHGSFFDGLDMGAAKEAYKEEFERGKDVARDMKKNEAKSKEIFSALEKLGELRDAGVLTDEEFDAKKKDLLDQLEI